MEIAAKERDLARMRKLPLMLWKVHLAREIAMDAIESGAKQTLGWLGWSRLWTLPWMRWKVEQNRHLARMRQAARQASRQAMEIAIDAMESGAKQTLG